MPEDLATLEQGLAGGDTLLYHMRHHAAAVKPCLDAQPGRRTLIKKPTPNA